jgi:ArsR family transcriptional regulator
MASLGDPPLRTPLDNGRQFHIIRTVETKRALAALAALSQEHRLAVFRLLVEHAPEGLAAGVIAERLKLAPATLSFHLKELSHAGLVASRQDGRFVWYRADVTAMNGLVAYLTENCCGASSVCDTACVPAGAPRPVAAPLPARRKRKSA